VSSQSSAIPSANAGRWNGKSARSPWSRDICYAHFLNIPALLQLVIIVPFGLILAIFVHESGHALAGRVLGFRVLGVSLPYVTVNRTNSSWKVTWSRALGVSGSVRAIPLSGRYLRVRLFVVTSAGPCASMLSCAICAWIVRNQASAWPEFLMGSLSSTGLFSLLTGSLALLPQRTRLGISDGLWMLTALIGGPESERNLSQWLLWGSSVSGLRPREWNPDLVERALGGPPTPLSRWLEYNWHADNGHVREAAKAIEWWLNQKIPQVDLALWWYEAAWFEAFSSGDHAAAKERLNIAEQFPQDERLDCSAWKARAVIAACEGRRADAASAAANAEQAIRHENLDEGLAKGIREDLRSVLNPEWRKPVGR
jgi:hypothetical protein